MALLGGAGLYPGTVSGAGNCGYGAGGWWWIIIIFILFILFVPFWGQGWGFGYPGQGRPW